MPYVKQYTPNSPIVVQYMAGLNRMGNWYVLTEGKHSLRVTWHGRVQTSNMYRIDSYTGDVWTTSGPKWPRKEWLGRIEDVVRKAVENLQKKV